MLPQHFKLIVAESGLGQALALRESILAHIPDIIRQVNFRQAGSCKGILVYVQGICRGKIDGFQVVTAVEGIVTNEHHAFRQYHLGQILTYVKSVISHACDALADDDPADLIPVRRPFVLDPGVTVAAEPFLYFTRSGKGDGTLIVQYPGDISLAALAGIFRSRNRECQQAEHQNDGQQQ